MGLEFIYSFVWGWPLWMRRIEGRIGEGENFSLPGSISARRTSELMTVSRRF